MKKMMKKQEGFTLIELIIVIAILAIIAAVAIPNIVGAVENSRKAADVSNGKVLMNAAATVIAKNDSLTDAEIEGKHYVNDLKSTNAFDVALGNQLNGGEPSPKYQSSTYSTFMLDIDSAHNIVVYASNSGGSSTRQVAPDASSAYDQK